MGYIITIFRELRERFPTWTAFHDFLVSDEGGNLLIIYGQLNKAIIRYEKGATNLNIPHVRWFRSVVWDTSTHLPVCVAPPKATPLDTYPVMPLSPLYYQDYMDGVMVNAYDRDDPVLVTRSSFEATGTYYSERSFNELVQDAIVKNDIGELANYFPLNATFISLLLQHPEHRVVEPIRIPRLYQIHSGKVLASGDVEIEEQGLPYAPPILTAPTANQSLASWIAYLAEEGGKGWSWQGATIKDNLGQRWRIRSSTYRMVRSLRGYTTRDDVRFAQLYTTHLMDTYLYYYPEDRDIFNIVYNRLKTTVKTLYDRYIRHHITKTLLKEHVEVMWKPHLFALHGYYLYTLRPNSQFIREKDVWDYVRGLPWQQLLFIINRREIIPHMMVS